MKDLDEGSAFVLYSVVIGIIRKYSKKMIELIAL